MAAASLKDSCVQLELMQGPQDGSLRDRGAENGQFQRRPQACQ